MNNPLQQQARDAFLKKCYDAAVAAGHPFPEVAACEAALESAWGTSQLAILAQNLFGEKQHAQPIYETLDLPTHEYVGGQLVATKARWVKFPDIASCFAARIATIRRLAATPVYSGYADSLTATNAEDWVRDVSRNWSTDPLRADKVLAIYQAHRLAFPSPTLAADPAPQT